MSWGLYGCGEAGPGPIFDPFAIDIAQPFTRGNNTGYGSNSSTFTAIPFSVGTALIWVHGEGNSGTRTITLGGTNMTLLYDPFTDAYQALYSLNIASAGNYTLVVNGGAGQKGCLVVGGTLVNANATPTATAVRGSSYVSDPQATSSITCPSTGIIVGFYDNVGGGTFPTRTVNAPNSELVSGNTYQGGGSAECIAATMSISRTTGPVSFNHASSGCRIIGAAFGP